MQRNYIAPAVFTFLVWVFLFQSFPAFSQVRVEAKIDSSGYRIGDWIAVHISIHHPTGTLIHWQPVDTLLSNFKRVSESGVDTLGRNNFITESKTFLLTTFDTGLFFIPRFAFLYESASQGTDTAISNELPIQVSTISVDVDQTFRTIKPLLTTSTEDSRWWMYVIAGVLVMGGITMYYFFRRNKSLAVTSALKEDAYKNILEKLMQLEREGLWQKDQVEHYYIRLTGILREYIRLTYDVPALEKTSGEIINYLKEKVKDPVILERLSGDLQLADLVKFANANPSPAENKNIMRSAVDFVNQTKKK